MSEKKLGAEEGDICNRDGCKGVIKFTDPENCSCHINPPCSACLDTRLHCPTCCWVDEEE